MANLLIHKPFEEAERQRACNAVNLLIQRGHLPREISYDFHESGGKTYVRFWIGDMHEAHREDRIAHVPVREVIGSAGAIPVIDGKSDNL